MPATDSMPLKKTECYIILIVAFLGWLFAGVQMGINGIVHHPAARSLLGPEASGGAVGQWSGWLVVAFLLGAATGGYCFGGGGERFGRARAMALSIGCYALFSALTVLAPRIEVMWLLRYLTCVGIGGMWPNGMALLQEAWPNTAKPILAGILGTSANVGIMLFALLCMQIEVSPEHWQWTFWVGSVPIILAVIAWYLVPESPKWLAEQKQPGQVVEPVGLGEVFSGGHIKLTLIGIVLAFVPLFGGWGVANWANYWAADYDERQATVSPEVQNLGKPDLETNPDSDQASSSATVVTASNLKAIASINRSWPGAISSLLGGALALVLGRRFSYALLCILAFICTQFLYALPDPTAPDFLFWVRGLGFFSGFFFGWLPLCLPELFPTRVRSTGSGVSFNFGRIIVAGLVIFTSLALKSYFEGNYDQVGKICGYIYLLGVVAVFAMPKDCATDNSQLLVK